MSNSLDLDQARHFVGPDLVPNCLQRLSADDTCRQSVLHSHSCMQHNVSCGTAGVQCSGSVGRALDWRSKGCWF